MPSIPIHKLRAADLPVRFGRYELRSILGRGGMACVYQAVLHGPAGFRKVVALKLLTPAKKRGGNTQDVLVAVQEARIGGLLHHPNLVDVYELGEEDSHVYIAMEWVDGETLGQMARAVATVPPRVIVEIGIGTCRGLASAHGLHEDGRHLGLVHRDMKPGNVLISWEGDIKVADFGIASTHMEHAASQFDQIILGTPAYMAPEQMIGDPVGAHADIFSVGTTLTHLCLGAPAYDRDHLSNLLQGAGLPRGTLLEEAARAEIDNLVPGLGALLSQCMQVSPEARPDNAAKLAAELERVLSQLPPGPGLRAWMRERRFGRLETSELQEPTAHVTSPSVQHRRHTNLGPPLDAFVGRSEEIADLRRDLHLGTRLLTLKGPGGAGKTRLARRAGRTSLETYPGGVWFVDCAAARTAADIVYSTATALDIPLADEMGLDAQIERVGAALHGRGALLLILDNLEQVLGHMAPTLGVWMAASEHMKVIATSREPLRLPGEVVTQVDPFPTAEGAELFRIRAQHTGASWPADPTHGPTIEKIVDALDGIPLAIELAAARANALAPTDLLERLDQRFRLLKVGAQGASPRQATLHGLIAWSWDLLAPWEQAALQQLSVFSGGFWMAGAEEVLDLDRWPEAPWGLDAVASLLDKSLIRSHEVLGQPRFSMYQSVRAFVAEDGLGDPEARAGAGKRAARHHSSLGSTEAIFLLTSHKGSQRMHALRLERDNLAHALAWALAQGESTTAARCALALAQIAIHHGPYSLGINAIEQTLALPDLDGICRGRLHQDLSWLQRFCGLGEQALASTVASLEHLEGADPPAPAQTVIRTLRYHSILLQDRGEMEEAWVYQRRALELSRTAGDALEASKVIGGMGLLWHAQGEMDEAAKCFKEAWKVAKAYGDSRYEGLMIGNLAMLRSEQGRWDEAATLYGQALSIARRIDFRRVEALTLSNLGHGLLAAGRLDEAKETLATALSMAQKSGNRMLEGFALGNLGNTHVALGDPETAKEQLTAAIDLVEKDHPHAAGAYRGSLALVMAEEGDISTARQLLDEADPLLDGLIGIERGRLWCRRAQVELCAGDLAKSQAALTEAQSSAQEAGLTGSSELGQLIAKVELSLSEAEAADLI